jgi:hypothetical protein
LRPTVHDTSQGPFGFSVRETIDTISINRTSLYQAVKRGELHPVKWGRKTLFLAPDLATFLGNLKKVR